MQHSTNVVRQVENHCTSLEARSADPARYWRPFPRAKEHILCGELIGEQPWLVVREELQVILPSSPYSLVDGRGNTTLVGPGRIVIINAHEPHRFIPLSARRAPLLVIALGADVLKRWGAPAASWFPSPVLLDEAIAARLRASFAELRAPIRDVDSRTRLLGALSELVVRYATERPEPPPTAPMSARAVWRLRDHLEKHVNERLTLSEMGRIAMLSRFHLVRAFARELGIPPRAYQMRLRLARALTLIAEGASLTFAAFDTGFADQAHMTRSFQQFFKITPGEYARSTASSKRDCRGASALSRAG